MQGIDGAKIGVRIPGNARVAQHSPQVDLGRIAKRSFEGVIRMWIPSGGIRKIDHSGARPSLL